MLAASASPVEPLIRLRGAVIGHGRKRIAGPLDFELRPHEFLVVAGPNGAGKSTFVKTLLGVLRPLQGAVEGRGLRFGYVPQREHLDEIWPFSALEIVKMGRIPSLAPFRFFGREEARRALQILELVGLLQEAQRPFRELSGGQQQRALIARALFAEPDVLILDEPTNHLDVPGERAVHDLLGSIHREQGRALVVICHHLAPALRHATRLAVLRDGDLVAGDPEVIHRAGALGDLVDDDFVIRPAAPREAAT